jgi:hypothetical protein
MTIVNEHDRIAPPARRQQETCGLVVRPHARQTTNRPQTTGNQRQTLESSRDPNHSPELQKRRNNGVSKSGRVSLVKRRPWVRIPLPAPRFRRSDLEIRSVTDLWAARRPHTGRRRA